MDELNNFFLGVQQVAQDAVDKAPYDRTFRGVIEEINGDGTCDVRINGRTYENIPYRTKIDIGDIVDILFPQNNPSMMFVQGSVNIVDMIYPVGSIYMSINNTNPSVLFGGSWQQIKDRFLLSAGDSYIAGDVGGEANHTLTVDEIPSHTHTYGESGYNALITNATTAFQSGDMGVQTGTGRYYPFTTTGAQYIRSTNTNSAGGSQAHNNMPPYLTVYMWQRIG